MGKDDKQEYTLEEYREALVELQTGMKDLEDAELRGQPWGMCPGEDCDAEFTMYDKEHISFCPQCGTGLGKDDE